MENQPDSATLASPAIRLTEVLERASRAVGEPALRQRMADATATLDGDQGEAFDALVVALNAFLAEHLEARRQLRAGTEELLRVTSLLHEADDRTQAAYRSDRSRFVRLCAALRMPAPPSWGEGDWTELLDRVVTLQALFPVDQARVPPQNADPPRTTWERLADE